MSSSIQLYKLAGQTGTAGTAGTNGTNGNADYDLISTTNITTPVGNITLTGLNSSYFMYIVELSGVEVDTDSAILFVRTGNGSIDSGASDYSYFYRIHHVAGNNSNSNNAASRIEIAGTPVGERLGNAANESVFGNIRIFNPSSSKQTRIDFDIIYSDLTTELAFAQGGGYRKSAAAIDRIRLGLSTGSFDAGTVKLYGIKAS